MKINCNYLEFPLNHTYKNGKYDLVFGKHELIHAAYTVGKSSWKEVNLNPYYSEHEIGFRIAMVLAFLNMEGVYIKRSVNFKQLDPSEKVSINYFLGMVFANLVMRKRFEVRWMIHLDLFKGVKNYIIGEKRPDFIGKKLNSSWNSVEAKGVQQKKSTTLDNAREQLINLVSVDGVAPDNKLISILYGKGDESLTVDIIDPEDEGYLKIETKEVNYVRDYYSGIFIVINKGYEVRGISGRKFAVIDLKCHKMFLGLDLFIFKGIQKENLDEMNKEIESYLKKYDDSLENTSTFEESFFIGTDGVYVECY